MTLTAFGFREGHAEAVFEDGVRLRIEPRGTGDAIEGMRRVTVVDEEGLVSAAGDLDDSGIQAFWGRQGEGQTSLAARLADVIEAERAVYRQYRRGRIAEEVWQERFRLFWLATIKTHRVQEALAAGVMPETTEPPRHPV